MLREDPPRPPDDPLAVAERAARELGELTGVPAHDVAVVLGSGWQSTADALGTTVAQCPTTQVAGFAAPAVAGHAGVVRSVVLATGHRALVMLGRTHLYEGWGVDAVVHGVRTAAAAGCRTVVLTNGSGGLRPDWPAGSPVLIADHLNLTGTTPLRGALFLDLTDLYSARLRGLCRELDPTLAEGVYAQVRGPQYETPAEVRMLAALGADLVGMSTALEAIAARQAGMEVLGVSLVTNPAAGLSDRPVDHAEVLAAGAAACERLGSLLAGVLGRL